MTEPPSPAEHPEVPLTDDEERLLDLVDDGGALDEGASGALAEQLDAQRQARDAVAARVEVPAFAREQAVRAALAAGRRSSTEGPGAASGGAHQADGSGTVTPMVDRRSRRQPGRWLAPLAGVAAAIILLVGGGALLSRSTSSDTAATSSGQAVSGSAAPDAVANGAASSTTGSGTDFGVADSTAELLDRVGAGGGLPAAVADGAHQSDKSAGGSAADGGVLGATSSTQSLQNQASPSAPSSYSAESNRALGVAGCLASARAAATGLADAPVTATGTIVYLGQPAFVYVFSPPQASVQVIAVSTADCHVVATARP